MNDEINLLVTFYQHHEMGDSLLRVALHCKRWPEFDDEHLMENITNIRERMPLHVQSIGPIVSVEDLFDVIVVEGASR